MKKLFARFILTIISIFVLSACSISIDFSSTPTNEPTSEPKNINDRYLGEHYSTNNGTIVLTINEITDDYIDADFQFKSEDKNTKYTFDKAYFENKYTAKGTGIKTESESVITKFDYTLELNYSSISFRMVYYEDSKSYMSADSIFLLTWDGFFRPLPSGYVNEPSIGKYKVRIDDACIKITQFDNRTNEKTIANADNGIFDGKFLYYVLNNENVHKLDVETSEDELVFSSSVIDMELDDCYDNKYFTYFVDTSNQIEDSAANKNLYIYDLEKEKNYFIDYQSVCKALGENRIAYTKDRGDDEQYAVGNLTSIGIHGERKVDITDSMFDACSDGEYIYYVEDKDATRSDFSKPGTYIIKCCDFFGKNVTELAELPEQSVVYQLTPEYIEFVYNVSDNSDCERIYFDNSEK